MASTNAKVTARERAGAAGEKRDAARVAHDKLIEEQVTAFYIASNERDTALAAAGDAEAATAAGVLALGDLDVQLDQIATRCTLDAPQVRALRKPGKAAKAGHRRPQHRRSGGDGPVPVPPGGATTGHLNA